MATATTLRLVLRAERRRNRAHRRCWALQDRAAVAGSTCSWRRRMVTPRFGSVLIGPRRLDQLGPQMGVAGLGDVSTPDRFAGGVLRGDQPGEAHERAGGGEPAPVADLAGDGQRPHRRHAAVGGQPGDRVGERSVGVPVRQIGLHRGQFGVAGGSASPGSGRRWPAAPASSKRCPSSHCSCLTVHARLPPDPVVAQQELAQPVPGTGAVADHRGAGPAQVPHRLLASVGTRIATSSPARCSRASRRQSRRSVFTRSPGAFGINAGATTSQATPIERSSRYRPNPVGPAS